MQHRELLCRPGQHFQRSPRIRIAGEHGVQTLALDDFPDQIRTAGTRQSSEAHDARNAQPFQPAERDRLAHEGGHFALARFFRQQLERVAAPRRAVTHGPNFATAAATEPTNRLVALRQLQLFQVRQNSPNPQQ